MDGEVIIKVSADTKNFDKKLLELEGKYKNKEADIKFSEYNLKQEEESLRELNAQYERQKAYQDEINQKLEEEKALLESIRNTPRDYRTQEGRIEDIKLRSQDTQVSNRIRALEAQQSAITSKILQQYNLMDEQELKVNKINARYEKQKNDLEIIAAKMQEINNDTSKTSLSLDKASGSTNKTLKSMTRWGLAIFGVRSAYMGIRQIMNGVFAQNTKLGDQMDAMKKSIAGAFTPIVEKILNLIRTLMAYINYLWRGLFGKNLFSEKVEKNLKSGAKSAKEIRNQLAGFDEANVLSSNSSSGGGAGGGGATDLKLSDVPIPGWLKWIRDFIEKHPTISKIIFGIAAFTLFGGWKMADGIFSTISKLLGGGKGAGASGLLGVLGILTVLTASIWTIKIVYDDAKKFGEKIDEDIKKGKKGLKDWASQEEDIDLILMNQYNHRLAGYEAIKDSGDFLTKIYGLDDERLKQAKSTAEVLKSEVDQEVNLYKQGKTNKRQQDEIKQAILDQVEYNNTLIKKLDWVGEDSSKIREINNDLIQDYKDMGGNVEIVKDDLIGINTIKFDDKKINVNVAVDTSNAQSKLDLLISKTSNAFSKIGVILGGTNTRVKYNASGGIVNLPGRGVPVANYAGEAGREGIIPMDNQQQMALLGQEIAKYVNINNVVNNYMDARKINTLLQQSANKEKLASNS